MHNIYTITIDEFSQFLHTKDLRVISKWLPKFISTKIANSIVKGYNALISADADENKELFSQISIMRLQNSIDNIYKPLYMVLHRTLDTDSGRELLLKAKEKYKKLYFKDFEGRNDLQAIERDIYRLSALLAKSLSEMQKEMATIGEGDAFDRFILGLGIAVGGGVIDGRTRLYRIKSLLERAKNKETNGAD